MKFQVEGRSGGPVWLWDSRLDYGGIKRACTGAEKAGHELSFCVLKKVPLNVINKESAY